MTGRVLSAPHVHTKTDALPADSLHLNAERARHAMPQIYTVNEVAKLLRVHRNTVDQQRQAGRLGFVRIGRRILISAEQVNDYIEQQKDRSTWNRNNGYLSTETIGLYDDRIRPTSTSIGADRIHAAFDARARVAQTLTRRSGS